MEQDETPSNFSQQPPSALLSKRRALDWIVLILSLSALIISTLALIRHQPLTTPSLSQNTLTRLDSLDAALQKMQIHLNELSQTNQNLSQKINKTQKILLPLTEKQSRSSDDWELKKARYYLALAQINNHWTYDTSSTIAMLKQADNILARVPFLSVQNVRQAIAQDILNLEQIPNIDTPGILAKLRAAQKEIDILTKISPALFSTATTTQPSPTTWREHVHNNLQQLQSLVVIHHQDENFLAQLSPQYLVFLRENIHLNLQETQIGLIQHQPLLYCAGLAAAINNLKYGFHPQDPKTQAIIHLLKSLQAINVAQNKLALSDYEKILNNDLSTNTEKLP